MPSLSPLNFNYMFYGLLEVFVPSPTSSPTYNLCSKSANPSLSLIINLISFLGLTQMQAQTILINSYGLLESPTSHSRLSLMDLRKKLKFNSKPWPISLFLLRKSFCSLVGIFLIVFILLEKGPRRHNYSRLPK